MVDIQEAINLQSQGKFEQAEKIYLEFLKNEPEQPDVSNLLGLIYLCTNKFDLAKKYFEFAIKGFPCAEYYQNYGLLYYKQQQFEQAMLLFEKSMEYEPTNVNFIRKFAKLAQEAKQYQKAIDFYKKSLNIEPKDCVGLNNVGILYEKLHDAETAKEYYKKSLKIKPNYEAFHNLGVLYRNERNLDESIRCLKEALKFQPYNDETLKSLGMTYLHKKDIKNGHKYFEKSRTSIFHKSERKKYRNYWDGKEHLDKTLLVYYFVGYGDHIMFSRYLPFLKKFFKKVKVSEPEALQSLFRDNFPGIEVTNTEDDDYDYSANIMELYNVLKMDFDHIPYSEGYYKADETLVKKFKEEHFTTNKPKIGLFWQGNPKVLKNRSIKLKELDKVLALENIDFYSFEIDDTENQISAYPHIKDLKPALKDFSYTAAALMNLDILVTIDSAIAHLAGALGVKTYLLLPYASEWRWFDDTETTPWYNSVTIFKQTENWIWQDVVERLYDKLKNLN